MSVVKSVTLARRLLKVPVEEWLQIKYGEKREFRTTFRSMSLASAERPTPVIAYRSGGHDFDSRLMVLEESWKESLGAISDESLAAEGCNTLAEFKVKWVATRLLGRQRRFNPLQSVIVHRLRPWNTYDDENWREHFFEYLYPTELRGL